MTHELLAQLLARWGLVLRRLRPELPLAGSPERVTARTVVEDAESRLFVVERFSVARSARRLRIAETQETLAARGLTAIVPPRRTRDGTSILFSGAAYWQVTPFVVGAPLPRPDYVFDAWRGTVAAGFLLRLAEVAALQPDLTPGDSPFSIITYIGGFLERCRGKKPGAHARATAVDAYLRGTGFHAAHEQLPTRFGHGDFHPVNILWQETGIAAVIDWEFSGPKPELYDAALMVGCLGMERPDALLAPMALAFLGELREQGHSPPASWAWFPELVLALRFAWLNEWLDRADREMTRLELEYMEILVDNRDTLARRWGLPPRPSG